MDDGIRLLAPALRQAAADERLSALDTNAVLVLWLDHLSPLEYRPLKGEVLAHLLKIRRESASRILRRLVGFGYLLAWDPPEGRQRLYLLANNVERRDAEGTRR